MSLFSKKEEDYNLKLKNAINEWITEDNTSKKMLTIKKIKKYVKIKLKHESGFSNEQFKFLNDVPQHIRDYDADTLKLMYLAPEDFYNQYRDEVIKKLTTKGVPVIFPRIEEQKTNKAGTGVIAGGVLFGLGGAVVGGLLGASSKQITENMVSGEHGTLKVADKGIVLSSTVETVRIEWDKVKGMEGNIIELIEGKNIILYNIPNDDIITPIINHRANPPLEDGW